MKLKNTLLTPIAYLILSIAWLFGLIKNFDLDEGLMDIDKTEEL